MKNKFLKANLVGLTLFMSGFANAGLVTDVVGIQASSVTSTSEYGAAYSADKTIDRTDYTSGVTSWADIESLSYDQTNYHTSANPGPGSITWDLSSIFNMDRVRLDWTNNGVTNNFSDFTIETSIDSLFTNSTSVYANVGAPSTTFEIINFTQIGVGQFIRLNWTSTDGMFGGLREIVVGAGNIASVPEPSTLAILALGLMGLASRRFKKQA
ncbi:MAG: hypothetical protein ACJAT7_001808 [Psychromonas sp.]|jgi:hypothetical protein|uniref:PEP-CTERM sorting domain-containing protein n=1 Tax=Psychromonas sp. TaxID=1884585 RepID=UPI0039E5CE82